MLDRNHEMQKLIAGFLGLTLLYSSVALAQNSDGTGNPNYRHHQYVPLPAHQQPRKANAPDDAMDPTVKEKAVDSRINNICRGC